jgi:hypothetical protein
VGKMEKKTWNAKELVKEFDVIGFRVPFVVVERKSDKVKGSMEFTHTPRVFFNWKEDKK